MTKSHNKKRNVGIIYEQLINFMCSRLLEEDNKTVTEAVSLIKNHFKPGSQLQKEYKLFKALATTSGVSDQLASSIINEAKKACNKMFDNDVLEKEKSRLIRDLNYSFGKGRIFEEKVENYRTYATIQTLLNEWRDDSDNFDKTTEYEIKLHQKLTGDIKEAKPSLPVKVDGLTRKLMKEMFNKKYDNVLNEGQQNLINTYISDNSDQLVENFSKSKISCIKVLENYMSKCSNRILINKKQEILRNIKNLDENNTSKENLQKFLTIEKLKEEILGE
jgi:hypothetical protein